jgi:hypothetical protein
MSPEQDRVSLMDVKNYIHTCTIRKHDILVLKHTLVKFVCDVRKYPICSLVQQKQRIYVAND